jgi:hypothetical protein
VLGHVPSPDVRLGGVGDVIHTHGPDGLRFSGERQEAVPDGGPILAVGDSFTYGDEVDDLDTWPAQLQRLTGLRVMNGGVTGYGFDQIVLRAEQLAEKYRPSVIIVSFIEHDILRVEWRRLWGRDKPWFAIEGDQLVLKGVPVSDRRPPTTIGRRLEKVLPKLPLVLQRLTGYQSRAHAGGQGLVIARRLIGRLARLRTQHSLKIVVMAQYAPIAWIDPTAAKWQRRVAQAVLSSATSHGLSTLDTFQRLATEPKPLDFYGPIPECTHMNARGNLTIATLLAATLPTLLHHQRDP